jgi:hypothetical protein
VEGATAKFNIDERLGSLLKAADFAVVHSGSMLPKKGLRRRENSDSCLEGGRRFGDDGRHDRDQGQLFYEFSLDEWFRLITCCDGLMYLRRLFWPICTKS